MTLLTAIPMLFAQPATDPIGKGMWMPPRGSTQAGVVDDIFNFILWISIFFFVLIVVLEVYFVIRYARWKGRRSEATPSHNTPLELAWTTIPLILVIAIFYVGLKGYVGLRTAPANTYEVIVTAQRWSWTFEHRNGAKMANRLVVPANRPVELTMNSLDVIHSLYIPAFRAKQDVVPGRYTKLWFQAEPGEYPLYCAEYCGQKHSEMVGVVIALEEEEFQRVIADEANWIDKYDDERLYEAGNRLYKAYCTSCHSIDGTRIQGPSFQETHRYWGKERPIEGGKVVVNEDYIRNSILNPGSQIVATYPNVMNSFQGQLKPREVMALIQFIKRLNELYDDKGNPIEQ
jgi:cytochrome c oxidase subunit 2